MLQYALFRGVVPGGPGVAIADYAHLITTGTPGFSDLPKALVLTLRSLINGHVYLLTYLLIN